MEGGTSRDDCTAKSEKNLSIHYIITAINVVVAIYSTVTKFSVVLQRVSHITINVPFRSHHLHGFPGGNIPNCVGQRVSDPAVRCKNFCRHRHGLL